MQGDVARRGLVASQVDVEPARVPDKAGEERRSKGAGGAQSTKEENSPHVVPVIHVFDNPDTSVFRRGGTSV